MTAEIAASKAPEKAENSLAVDETTAGDISSIPDSLLDASYPNFDVKHPLGSSWTLFFDNPNKKANMTNWMDNVKKLITFSTVEDFWGVMNNITPASGIPQGSNYHFFKEGIQPMWEDPANAKGGKWLLQIPKSKSKNMIDDMWLNTLLAIIGEQITPANELCGAVVSIRRQADKLAVWTRSAMEKETQENIGRQLKDILGLNAERMEYQYHDESLAKNSSFATTARYKV